MKALWGAIRLVVSAIGILVFAYVFIWLLWAAFAPAGSTQPTKPVPTVQIGDAACVQRAPSGAVILCDAPVVTR